MNRMKKREVISIFFFIAVGLLFTLGSFKYVSLSSGIPNAGFFPFLGGIILIFLSLILLVPVIRQKERSQKDRFFPQKDSLKRLLTAVVILSFYGFGLEYIGFLLTTLVFMIAILRFIEPPDWMTILITSVTATGLCYLIFKLLLKVQLP
jgi:hypothetical protein